MITLASITIVQLTASIILAGLESRTMAQLDGFVPMSTRLRLQLRLERLRWAWRIAFTTALGQLGALAWLYLT